MDFVAYLPILPQKINHMYIGMFFLQELRFWTPNHGALEVDFPLNKGVTILCEPAVNFLRCLKE